MTRRRSWRGMFLEPAYFLLLAAAVAAYYLLPRRRMAVLIASGLGFYAVFGGLYLLVLLAEVAFVHFCARRAQSAWFILGAGVPLLLLGAYKYVFQALAPATRFASIADNFLLPLGISYITFELLHYLAEARRGSIKDGSFLGLLSFVLFFPSFASGPIKRFDAFIRQPRSVRLVPGNLLSGSFRIALGLFKKLVIADALVGPSDALVNFLDPSAGALWAAVFAFSLRLYFDFSAYSDIAIGSAKLLGISVPENFANPYLKGSVREFWRSWHMSLTSWARDYVYIPLGGSHGSALFTVRNTLVVFAAIGLWHGGTLSFLLWGLYNGALVALYGLYALRLRPRFEEAAWYRSPALRFAGIASTFVLISFGWVFFTTNAALLPHVLGRAFLLS